jgi:transposase
LYFFDQTCKKLGMAKPLVADSLWSVLQPLLPGKTRRSKFPGRKPIADRAALTGILFVLRSGMAWRDLPLELGCASGMTCWRRLRDWQKTAFGKNSTASCCGVCMWPTGSIGRVPSWIPATCAPFLGLQTGPNPTDRRKAGSKHHLCTDAQGVPLSAQVTAANVHDSRQLQPLLLAILAVRGKVGRPRQRPDAVQGDRAYGSRAHHRWLRTWGITDRLARKEWPHGSGLSKTRWVVERTLSWLHRSDACAFATSAGQTRTKLFSHWVVPLSVIVRSKIHFDTPSKTPWMSLTHFALLMSSQFSQKTSS